VPLASLLHCVGAGKSQGTGSQRLKQFRIAGCRELLRGTGSTHGGYIEKRCREKKAGLFDRALMSAVMRCAQ